MQVKIGAKHFHAGVWRQAYAIERGRVFYYWWRPRGKPTIGEVTLDTWKSVRYEAYVAPFSEYYTATQENN